MLPRERAAPNPRRASSRGANAKPFHPFSMFAGERADAEMQRHEGG